MAKHCDAVRMPPRAMRRKVSEVADFEVVLWKGEAVVLEGCKTVKGEKFVFAIDWIEKARRQIPFDDEVVILEESTFLYRERHERSEQGTTVRRVE